MPPTKLPTFSNRMIADHRGIDVLAPPAKGGSYILSVVGEYLVAPTIARTMVKKINATRPLGATRTANVVGTVFQGLGVPPGDDIAIVKVDNVFKNSAPVNGLPATFGVLQELRKRFSSGNPRLISLNHVLVPANWGGAGCPAGPPFHIKFPPHDHATEQGSEPEITVIDSGYNDWWGQNQTTDPWGDEVGPWAGKNPLLDLCTQVHVHRADFFSSGGSPSSALAATLTNSGSNWHAGTADRPSTSKKGVLDALAGHANFVAGTVARHVDMPTIHLWSHNGSFVHKATGDEFPCEAAVCRSIVMSQQDRKTHVIHTGFAFPTVSGKTSLTASTDELSVVWEATFRLLGERPAPIFTAPAGNEGVTDLYFPAALATAFPSPGLFDNVIGVGSMIPGTTKPSAFTNRGTWVTCSAYGERVHSTFIPVGPVRCEDDEHKRVQSFANSWARWQGTSFSAPKVAAGVAARLTPGMPPSHAWAAFKTAMARGSDATVGIYFEF